MTFEEVLPALRAGKKIKCDGRVYFISDDWVKSFNINAPSVISLNNTLWFDTILADDWEIVE